MRRIRPAPEFELEDTDGNIYPLSFPGRLLQSIDGLGLPPVRHWATRSPFQDGQTHWGYAIQPRVINAVLYLRGCDRADMYAKRRENIAMLSPRNGPHKLRFITPDLLKYELHDVYVTGGYTLSSQDQPTPNRQIGGVQLTAYDPIWKWVNSPLGGGETRDAYGRTCVEDSSWTLVHCLTIPFTAPFLLGTRSGTNQLTCTNDGSWATRPTIAFEGPVYDFIITNSTNGWELVWNGYIVDTGETITIDIAGKTCTSDVAGDLSGYLSGDSGSFCLDPGVNTIDVFATGGVVDGTTTVSVCWYLEILGV